MTLERGAGVTDEGIAVPAYLAEVYWWAYMHPRGVKLFERQWLVNLILWGNFGRLRDAALHAMGGGSCGRMLQVACVYGDLTPRLAQCLAPGATLDVVDVLPIQLANLARKLPPGAAVDLHHADAANLPATNSTYDRVLVFFLLHEQPEAVRRATLAEATRVLKPGGKLVVVDYHRPSRAQPLRALMQPLLARLEPFALDLWRSEIRRWMPSSPRLRMRKTLFCGGLYQMLECWR